MPRKISESMLYTNPSNASAIQFQTKTWREHIHPLLKKCYLVARRLPTFRPRLLQRISTTFAKSSPNVGREPKTVGGRVQCSTDWASRAQRHMLRPTWLFSQAFHVFLDRAINYGNTAKKNAQCLETGRLSGSFVKPQGIWSLSTFVYFEQVHCHKIIQSDASSTATYCASTVCAIGNVPCIWHGFFFQAALCFKVIKSQNYLLQLSKLPALCQGTN